MKTVTKLIWLSMATLVPLMGCDSTTFQSGEDISSQFLSENQGEYTNKEFSKWLKIDGNGMFTMKESEVVKIKEPPTLPPYICSNQSETQPCSVVFPANPLRVERATCGIERQGRITKVIHRTKKARRLYADFATHLLSVEWADFSLNDQVQLNSTSTQACLTFEDQQQTKSGQTSIMFAEVISKDQIRFHTNNATESSSELSQKTSTEDENFYRLNRSQKISTPIKIENVDILSVSCISPEDSKSVARCQILALVPVDGSAKSLSTFTAASGVAAPFLDPLNLEDSETRSLPGSMTNGVTITLRPVGPGPQPQEIIEIESLAPSEG